MVKVVPKNDDIRKLLKHPTAGALRAEGSSDWPDDSFTARRVADGDVTIEQAEKKEDEKKAEERHEHEEDKPDRQAVADKPRSKTKGE